MEEKDGNWTCPTRIVWEKTLAVYFFDTAPARPPARPPARSPAHHHHHTHRCTLRRFGSRETPGVMDPAATLLSRLIPVMFPAPIGSMLGDVLADVAADDVVETPCAGVVAAYVDECPGVEVKSPVFIY